MIEPRQRHRERDADAGTGAIACALPVDQEVDAAREVVEVLIVESRVIRRRVDVKPRQDRDQPKGGVRIQAVSHRQASQPLPDPAIANDGAEQFIERRSTGGHVAGHELALGRPIALGDRERGHLAPEQQPPTEFHESLRWLATSGQFGRPVGPDHPPRLGIDAKEQDQPFSLRRRDRPGLELKRKDSCEVEPVGRERSLGSSDKIVEVRRGDGRPEGSGHVVAARTRPQDRDRGLNLSRIGVDLRRQVGELHARSQPLGASHLTRRQRRDDRVDVWENVRDHVAMLSTHPSRIYADRPKPTATCRQRLIAGRQQPTARRSARLVRGNPPPIDEAG